MTGSFTGVAPVRSNEPRAPAPSWRARRTSHGRLHMAPHGPTRPYVVYVNHTRHDAHGSSSRALLTAPARDDRAPPPPCITPIINYRGRPSSIISARAPTLAPGPAGVSGVSARPRPLPVTAGRGAEGRGSVGNVRGENEEDEDEEKGERRKDEKRKKKENEEEEKERKKEEEGKKEEEEEEEDRKY